MAAVSLLPGIGGAYVSETFDSSSTTGADTIDCSLCAQLLIQVNSSSGGGTFQMTRSLAPGSTFSSLGTPISFVDGTTQNFEIGAGPFGVVKIDATSVTGTGTVKIVGYPMQRGF